MIAACRSRRVAPKTHGFEYYRHGTLSPYAALNPQTQTGEVMGQTAARHTSQEFVAFLKQVVATQLAERDVHVILDNFATHKTELVKHLLQQDPNVYLQFTPAYSSWLNQVECWFGKLQRNVIDRGIVTSVADLKRKILRYIRLYQKTAKSFQWKYANPRRRILPASDILGTAH